MQLDQAGIRRPDIFAFDRVMYGPQAAPGPVTPANSDSNSGSGHSGSEMEVDENIVDDIETEFESEDQGDDTAEVTNVARAVNGKIKGSRGRNERVIAPEEVRAHLRWLFRNERNICSLLFGRQGTHASTGSSMASADIFFLDVLAVSPTRFRPASKMDDKLFEHPHNEHLAKVLNTSYTLRDINSELTQAAVKGSAAGPEEQRRLLGRLFEALVVLQSEVNSFIDSSKTKTPMRGGKLPTPGVKQGLEKKEGLFRMHMMVRFYIISVTFCSHMSIGKASQLCSSISHITGREH
jgi:DNA-directed RNA polymerase beta' subunit